MLPKESQSGQLLGIRENPQTGPNQHESSSLLDSPLEVGTCVATAIRAISASSLTSMVVGERAAGGLLSLSLSLCYNPGSNCDRQLCSVLG
ncbi:hypothetical protein EYF80_032268 [Liparis tanakae]|uniref:Uncharacterized protein n=1 Tax=Liparis tanakae TaxID=230148 RepID=A0A4Z2GY62_9TELE|nr:hypothetical protein EYF80_032268 [Liparis tanakae]